MACFKANCWIWMGRYLQYFTYFVHLTRIFRTLHWKEKKRSLSKSFFCGYFFSFFYHQYFLKHLAAVDSSDLFHLVLQPVKQSPITSSRPEHGSQCMDNSGTSDRAQIALAICHHLQVFEELFYRPLDNVLFFVLLAIKLVFCIHVGLKDN